MAKQEDPGVEEQETDVKLNRNELIAEVATILTALGKPYKRSDLLKSKNDELLAWLDELDPEYQAFLAAQAAELRLAKAPEGDDLAKAVDGYEELTGSLIVQSTDRSSREVWIRVPNRKHVNGEVLRIPGFAILIKEGRNGCWHSEMDYNVPSAVEDYYFEQAKASGRLPESGRQVILGLIRDEMLKKNRLGLGSYQFIDDAQFKMVNEEEMYAAKAAAMVKVFSLNPQDPLFAKFKELIDETDKKYPLPVSRSFVATGPVTV